MSHPSTRTRCAIACEYHGCPNAAAMIALLPGPGPYGTLTVDGFRAGTEVAQPLSDPRLAGAVQAAGPDLAANLYDRDEALAPFWCPTCERAYCVGHWRLAEGRSGHLGTCPYGHRRPL